MLLAERLAYGARAVIMASMVVSGAIFLRMIAVGEERGHVRGQCWHVRICIDRRGVLTVATELSAGLGVRQSGVAARLALCWHKRSRVKRR